MNGLELPVEVKSDSWFGRVAKVELPDSTWDRGSRLRPCPFGSQGKCDTQRQKQVKIGMHFGVVNLGIKDSDNNYKAIRKTVSPISFVSLK